MFRIRRGGSRSGGWSRRRALVLPVVCATLFSVMAFTGWEARSGSAQTGASQASPTVVKTTGGAVRGKAAQGVRQFNGIRYGQAPVGALRWKAPVAAKAWSGVKNAQSPGSACVQTAAAWRPAAASTNEDCLFLNVWTPTRQTQDAKLPVTVFFHGGGFVNGAGTDVAPADYVKQGGIVVTVNYRLGSLGWLTLPGLDAENKEATSGNYGLLDQELALKWIKANASAFGGDASKVMVTGQSAGAESICSLLAAPSAAGLFQRAIMESSLRCAVNTRAAAQTADANFAKAAGCTGSDSEIVACLRDTPPAELLDAQKTAGAWRPAVDGTILPKSPTDAFASGDFNKVPVIIGSTQNEGGAFIYEQYDMVTHPATEAQYIAAVTNSYGTNAPAVLARYPYSRYVNGSQALAAVRTDSGFSCPALIHAGSLSAATTTYVYEFQDTTAPLRSYQLVPPSFNVGAQHSADLLYLWGAPTLTPLTTKQQALATRMIAYWQHFAATGNLSAPSLPKIAPYHSTSATELALTPNGPRAVTDEAAAHQCSFWDTLA
ncbi:carboxylesterase/lipase family protein [Streptomyces sp. cg40]|uniref:carboxylesterase/lipase family protein n=1 Tax=Streptomyces sp. cg40 TaxID=3419764 RepID=UPI003CFE6F68